jgi:hypothetical protein
VALVATHAGYSCNVMRQSNTNQMELRLAPPTTLTNALLEPYRLWMETVLGCDQSGTISLAVSFPFTALAIEELLPRTRLNRASTAAASKIKPHVNRCELPGNVSPKIALRPTQDRMPKTQGPLLTWDPTLMETPVAVWFSGVQHAVVAAELDYYLFDHHYSQQWVFVNRTEADTVLGILRESIASSPRRVTVYGGSDILLPEDGYRWDDIVLDSNANRLIREDFESFFKREEWFTRHRLPFRRGYLLHGPPGNGKTSVIRTMACHPQVSAFSTDLGDSEVDNETVSRLFNEAADNAPGLIILEDLDRLFGRSPSERAAKVSLQHLLNCLDGVGNRNGVIVVATANDPSLLDPAILKRPGRFDRVALFPNPSFEMRLNYLRLLSDGSLPEIGLAAAARQCNRFSFAQVRESYVVGGQFAFERDGEVTLEELLEGILLVKHEGILTAGRSDGREIGFCQEPSAQLTTASHDNRKPRSE